MNNLVIGNTSQLSYYFPEDYIKISSRNIDFDYLKSINWNRVYICIGESRKFLQDIKVYDDINFYLTLQIIESLKDVSRNIIIYSTCELWNQYDGQISVKNSFNFYSTSYLQSKYKISKFIIDNKKDYSNVTVLYPFNFNSIYRNSNFLFGKIFNSIIEKKVIEIGDTYFYRDIIHPNFVVQESINATSHKIIGSGRMIYVNDFIRDIYTHFNMKYEDYIIENISKFNEYEKRKEYYLSSPKNLYSYDMLLNDTIKDIKNHENIRTKLEYR
jgi:nucleoside-diphosphate-sugar epimerase